MTDNKFLDNFRNKIEKSLLSAASLKPGDVVRQSMAAPKSFTFAPIMAVKKVLPPDNKSNPPDVTIKQENITENIIDAPPAAQNIQDSMAEVELRANIEDAPVEDTPLEPEHVAIIDTQDKKLNTLRDTTPIIESIVDGDVELKNDANVEYIPVVEAIDVEDSPVQLESDIEYIPVVEAIDVEDSPVKLESDIEYIPVVEAIDVEDAPVELKSDIEYIPVVEAIDVEDAPVELKSDIEYIPVVEAVDVEDTQICAEDSVIEEYLTGDTDVGQKSLQNIIVEDTPLLPPVKTFDKVLPRTNYRTSAPVKTVKKPVDDLSFFEHQKRKVQKTIEKWGDNLKEKFTAKQINKLKSKEYLPQWSEAEIIKTDFVLKMKLFDDVQSKQQAGLNSIIVRRGKLLKFKSWCEVQAGDIGLLIEAYEASKPKVTITNHHLRKIGMGRDEPPEENQNIEDVEYLQENTDRAYLNPIGTKINEQRQDLAKKDRQEKIQGYRKSLDIYSDDEASVYQKALAEFLSKHQNVIEDEMFEDLDDD